MSDYKSDSKENDAVERQIDLALVHDHLSDEINSTNKGHSNDEAQYWSYFEDCITKKDILLRGLMRSHILHKPFQL